MSINHLINESADVKYNVYCKSLSATELIGGNTLVDDLSFKTQNADIVNLSSLPTFGNGGERLTSNGDGSVSWVVGAGSSGVDYNGTLPVAINKVAIYGATDGLLIKDSILNENDLLVTQSKAYNNEVNKLNKSGDTMTGNLDINNNNITNVNAMNIQEINSIAPQNGVYVKNEDFGITVFNGAVNSNLSNAMLYVASFEPAYPPIFNLNTGSQITQMKQTPTESSLFSKQTAFKLSTPATKNITLSTGTKELILDDTNSKVLCQNYDLDMNNKNITNVNNLQTLEIKSTGVNINIQDDIDMGLYDINNCNFIRMNGLSTNTLLNIVSNNSIDMKTNDLLNCNEIKTDFIASSTNIDVKMNSDLNLNGKNIIGLDLINGIQPSGGLYSESSGFSTASTTEIDILGQGANSGSLSIPANGFTALSVYSFKASGVLTGGTNDLFTIRAKSLTSIPTTVLLGEIQPTIQDNGLVNVPWDIMIDFTVRSVGVSGVAQLVLSGAFRYNNNSDVVRTFLRTIVLTTGFDTTVSNTLQLTFQNDATNPLTSFRIDQASFTKWY